jgi:hypothetical protein
MKHVDFASLIRFNTHTDTTTFPDTDILLLSNVYKDEIAKEITIANQGFFGTYAYRNLEAGVREYPLPVDLLSSIYTVEAKLDGVNWKPLDEMDLSLVDMATDEASIQTYFAGNNAKYCLFRGSLFIYSDSAIIDVTDGIKLWAILYPTAIPNLTDDRDLSVPKNTSSIGFPSQFHELLARRVGIAYKNSQDTPLALSEHEQNYATDLQRAIVSIRHANFSRAIAATEKVDNGFDY